MKVTIKMRVLIVLILILLNIQFVNAPITDEIQKDLSERIMETLRQKEWDNMYEYVVESIKEREGFVSIPYYCPGNVLTIGYGHAIKKGEIFNFPISEQEGDSLLRIDFNEAINFVRKTTNLEHIQLLAIAKFVYNVGSGNFYKSTLRSKILANENIDDEIVKWIKITTLNGIIESDWLLKSRLIELELFKLQS